MRLNFIKILFLIFLTINELVPQTKAIEYKLREAKPHKHRCAYHYKNKTSKENEEEVEEGKWLLKPSAIACSDELAIVWPEQTNIIGESTHENKENKKRKREELENFEQKTLCQVIFGKKEGEETMLRSAACDNEWIQPLARKCRKTCGTCCELPEFQCEDQAHSESHKDKYRLGEQSFSCYTIKNITNKCQKHSAWYPTLADHCQSTCGLCEMERKENKKRKREETGDDSDEKRRDLKIPRSRRILDRCQKSCGVCLKRGYKCRNKEEYNRRCKRWDHNNFCFGTKFSLAIKLHYCAEQCLLCDSEDDEEDVDEDIERGKQKWLI
uniref:ShKT domain-containing protein n=1 Tax=Meloidogyne hapla TaxID=6305 RepID=A0A1I8BRK0_MELHA